MGDKFITLKNLGTYKSESDKFYAQVSSLQERYDPTRTYAVDALVSYNGRFYKCVTAVTTPEAFDISKWAQIHLDSLGSGGGGGTSDYSSLTNKPQINSVTLSGNKSWSDLGLNNAIKTLDGIALTGSGDVKSGKVEQLYLGVLGTGIEILDIDALSTKYSHVLMFAHSQYADGYDQAYVVSLADVSTGTVTIVRSVPGWQDQLNMYVFTTTRDDIRYLDWNGGSNHAIYTTSIFGICKNA